MFYIEDQDPILVKYEVVPDQARLKGLYQDITARLGKYVHRSYEGSVGPYSFHRVLGEDMAYIRDYHEEPVEGKEGISRYEYDEFLVPALAVYIRRFLEGDTTAIEQIKKIGKGETAADDAVTRSFAGNAVNGTGGKVPEGQSAAQKELQQLLEKAPNEVDPQRFRQLTEMLMHYYQKDYDNEREEDIREYASKALSYIQFKPVMTLYKDKWNELRRVYRDVRDFYEGTGQFEELLRALSR